MCGRYTLTRPGEILTETLQTLGSFESSASVTRTVAKSAPPAAGTGDGALATARYNLAPSQTAPTIRVGASSEYEVQGLRWGLVSARASAPSSILINARAETIDRKPSFRDAFRDRRCLVPADGFFEWRRRDGQPYFFACHQRRGFCFAGLWSRGQGDDSERFCLVTTAANDVVRPVHDRMPVILERGDYGVWLDPSHRPEELHQLLRPLPARRMFAYPVGSQVNRVACDDPSLLAEVAPPPENLSLF